MPMITPALRHTHAAAPNTSPAASTSATATLAAQPLPPVPRIPLDAATLARIAAPVKKIACEEDVDKWKLSEAYAVYLLFLQRVCEACVGKPTQLPSPTDATSPLAKLITLLYTLDAWTDDIAPHSAPQRFGNLAFRDWGARLSTHLDELHTDLLPAQLHAFIPELGAYLLDAFGSFTRIDYGSGHELAFFAWVCLLYRLDFFAGEGSDEEVEESIGVKVFPLYLMVVWRLQDRYGLEPAGSHGVWGLDDFQFLPYVLGAAQLRTQAALRPAQIVAASSHPSILNDQLTAKDPATLISLPITLPRSLLVTTTTTTTTTESSSSNTAGEQAAVTPNLYLTSLLRIQALKRGPFHEHSPLLHDIATTVPNWVKVHMGMLKVYAAECLGKRVVVQHFAFGGVGFVWSDAPTAAPSGPTGRDGVGRPGVGLALGGVQGNMGSMGVPTARVMGGAGRLGHALGLGARPAQAGRQRAMQPPGVGAPPLRMHAPTPRPAGSDAADPAQQDRPS
ncbi:related to RRD1-Resistant to Rapamycin Deletion (protein phosphatase 2A regulator activity) [Sporisorium reilianum SRZ2]|uniref:Serine/threonine-protein phosphatase 2A activator n=1 Tax=Sporisorium reilianum (strain SRZ2) TaxID=999809 RepID=E6ZRF0_SPORE|nr:related to RRD1-Resistant to Rapamycin Deletion (protein phosphatase 2A regulator activity) [Sporisorium reilianum SRZ2]